MCSCYLKLRFQPKSFYKRRMDMVSSLKASRDVRLGSEMKADFTYKYKDSEDDDCAQQEYLFVAMLNKKFAYLHFSLSDLHCNIASFHVFVSPVSRENYHTAANNFHVKKSIPTFVNIWRSSDDGIT